MRGLSIHATLKEMFSDYFKRYENRYYGKYRGVVTAVDDPLKIGRIKVKVPALLLEAETDWAWPSSPFGGNQKDQDAHGMMVLPEVDDIVWVEFEEGNIGRPPIWTGMPFSLDALPHRVRALPDKSDEDGVKGIPGAAIPPSSANYSEYGKVRTIQMKSGSKLEFDETDGEERIKIWHKSGGHLEILSDGTMHVAGAGALRMQASQGSLRQYASENLETQVEGDVRLSAKSQETTLRGPAKMATDGDYLLRAGTISLEAAGDFTITAGTYKVNRQGNFEDQTGGQYSAMAGTNWQALASQQAKVIGQNSLTNGGLPSQTAMELKGQNGKTIVESVDTTGLSSYARMELSGGDPSGVSAALCAVMEAGTPATGGKIEIDGTTGGITVDAGLPLAGLKLGSGLATEPVLCGNLWSSLMSLVFAAIDLHVHTSTAPGTPTSPPLVPVSTIFSSGTAAKSTKVFTEFGG